MIVYCDFCNAKRCVTLVGTESRMVFRADGIFEGLRAEPIEACPFRDETKIIQVNFEKGERTK